MSLLIRALKQAEREHQARVSDAQPALAEPDRPGEAPGAALALEPLDGAPAPAPASESAREPPAPADAAATPSAAAPGLPAAPGRLGPAEVALPTLASAAHPALAPSSPVARHDPDPITESGAGPFLASVMTAAASASAQSPVRATAPPARAAAESPRAAAAPSTPHPQPSLDADAERREAARYLVAPDPQRQRARRRRLLAGAVLGLLLAAIGLGLWQYGGLMGMQDLPAYPRHASATVAAGPAVAHSQPGNPSGTSAPSAASRSPQKPAKPVPHAGPPALAPAAGPSVAAAGAHDPLAGAGSTAAPPADSGADHPAGAIRFRAPELAPEKIHALLQEGYGAAARGDAIAARKAYERVIEVDANNGDAWIGLATLAANSGDAAEANRCYRRALEIDPGDGVALAGLLGLQTGVDPQEYEARLRQLIAREASQPALQAALGKVLAREGRWLEAQEAFFQAWSADPAQADVAFNLAVSLERIRQPEAAIAYYRRALSLTQERAAHFDRAVARDRVAALLAAAAPSPANAGKAQGSAPPTAPKN
ncbi:conserved hypothetical protein [Burkholderiales bacterium]|nr:conserved hypothetical protein [Burkholderiales bacterium]